MARLRGLGASVTVLLCTAGEASHPDSPTTTPEQLAAVRLKEFGGALAHLLPDPDWRFLALPDGRLADHRQELHTALQRAIADAAAWGLPAERITLVAPYRHDGHTDHEALGAAAAEAAGAGGHGLLEYPIWYWLWADAADQAWQSWLRLPLDPAERQAKAAAMASHHSQVRPLSGKPGDEALLRRRSWSTLNGRSRRSRGSVRPPPAAAPTPPPTRKASSTRSTPAPTTRGSTPPAGTNTANAPSPLRPCPA